MAVVNQGGLQSHLISETELIQRMDELVGVLETESEPFDCFMNLNRAVYLHAQDQGISAILDGVQGDVLFPDLRSSPTIMASGRLPDDHWRDA